MHWIKFMIMQFLKEPMWFKVLIVSTLLCSIIFSSSFFSENTYLQGFSKLAAAAFFLTCGFKMRKSHLASIVLYSMAVICIFLSIQGMY
ncbi:hypothetical protein [Neobacillus sp. FSL H8-0543]|uniref:hypothetical protein n=1 Tax=Neobacillus sp. FSL H8-0543 TaxID=2954672 RepID=UPI00315993FC